MSARLSGLSTTKEQRRVTKTPAERKRDEHKRYRDQGLKRRELWVHPTRLDEFKKIKERLKKPLRERSQSG